MTLQTIDLKKSLKDFFGFDSFKGNQEAVIQAILEGKDSFVIMPTGAGKSLCYQLPALMQEGTAIIISPLIALMKNQVDSIRGFGESDAVAHFLNSSLTKTQSIIVKEDVTSGKTKMLYVAPETLKKEETVAFLRSVKVSFVAVDEAHCISEWGHDFRPEYRRIKEIIKAIDDVPMVALTATATPKVQFDIQKNLNMVDAEVFKSSFNRDNLYYEVKAKGKKGQTLKDILSFINKRRGKSGIVYCLSRKKVEEVAEILVANGVKALPYHAGLDAKTRSSHQDKFLMEDADVIVATIAFGMGIDKPDVRFVIHYDVPKSLEGYYQETGRSGRDGKAGDCVLFYNPNDNEKLEKFLKDKPVAEREIGTQLIMEMASFAESAQCRRKFLLHYFGEVFDDDNCNKMCDNCRHPKTLIDVSEHFVHMLNVVKATDGRVGMKHIINILMGKASNDVKAHKHIELPEFGIGSDKDEMFWKSTVRLALLNNLLDKSIEKYGLISVLKKGDAFIKSPRQVLMPVDTVFESVNDSDFENVQLESLHDEELYEKLKELQREVARKKNLPPYVIFQESSLEDMATKFPITMEVMENISGVGKNKALKFGKPFIELIAVYVEENNIDRPEDLVLKTVANKSGKKISIIQNIDKKLSIDDIARSQAFTVKELLDEMESIVYFGTKLDFSYYIDELIDDDVKEEIFDYFRSAEDNDLDAAVNEFEGDFTHDEMQLFRIQFISEVAN
ncbi:MAG: ATP-dependent DNA helicase RecQ [Bacteroidia bacterium]|jgi:ATP-dependent DNA helicase RecQ